MAIITRLSRLVRADLHAVLDLVEEPEVLLRQAIREMSEELAAAEQRIRHRRAEMERLDDALAQSDATLKKLDGELDLCFESGKDDLARSLVKRKLETQGRRQRLAQKRVELEKAQARDEAELEENRDRFESLRQQAELVAEEAGDEHEEPIAAGESVTADEVEVAFLQEQKRRRSK